VKTPSMRADAGARCEERLRMEASLLLVLHDDLQQVPRKLSSGAIARRMAGSGKRE
jgi:hypothetical protein